MRLPDNHVSRALALALSLGTAAPALAQAANGPGADFPVTLGDAYSVGNVVFQPADTMNFDAVGHASVGSEGGGLVSAAHHTLPVPSYVEVTSLESGRTILVRVDRRGPMDSPNLIELSSAAAAQLGVSGDAAVRVRRVNPPEQERALLRAGAAAPERMPTPKALLAVLARKLDAAPMVTLTRTGGAPALAASVPSVPLPLARPVAPTPVPLARTGAPAPTLRGANSGVPLPAMAARGTPIPRPQIAGAPAPLLKPVAKPAAKPAYSAAGAGYAPIDSDLADAATLAPAPKPVRKPTPQIAVKPAAKPADIYAVAPAAATGEAVRSGMLVVQAGAFAVKGNAQSVAAKLGAKLDSAGNVWRVRMGPYSSRAQAEAALAKARAAGYSEARIQPVG